MKFFKKKLTPKEEKSLRIKEKIVDTLMEKPHEFYIRYSKMVRGTAVIMARDMKEAQVKLDEGDYDMEDDDEDIDWDEIEDSEE